MLLLSVYSAAAFAAPLPSCTLLADARSGRVLLRAGLCERSATPASTFKIALSLMGFDRGVLRDPHTPILQFQKGDVDWRDSWRSQTDPARWMKESVVWYSQRIVALLGRHQFENYVRTFGYGNRDLSGKPARSDGRRMEWINSSLQITPAEQLNFLQRLVTRQLPVSAAAVEQTAAILKQDMQSGGWTVYGKTGSGAYSENRDVGWFVGWAVKDRQTVVFVRQTAAESPAGPAGLLARDAFLSELPELLRKTGLEADQTSKPTD